MAAVREIAFKNQNVFGAFLHGIRSSAMIEVQRGGFPSIKSGRTRALLPVSFPDHQATLLVNQLDLLASANGGNVFLGEITQDPHNSDYRTVAVDITKQDWHRLQVKLAQAGWQRFGHDADMIHDLPGTGFLVARPKF